MKHFIGPNNPMRAQFEPRAGYHARHFTWSFEDGVGTVTLSRPERKNPLTFDSYAELRDLFQALKFANDVKVVVVTGAGGNFCSGGDVHEIIALACDLRYGTPATKTAFLFTRVGLAGADMGACALLPRVIGQGRASELLFSGRAMTATEGLAWGFFNALHDSADLLGAATQMARDLAAGPTFAHAMTKTMLQQEWAMSIEQAIEAEAQAQAICMQTRDFERAYLAFVAKEKPVFEGN